MSTGGDPSRGFYTKPRTDLSCQSSQSVLRAPDLWHEEGNVTERMKCLENRQQVINSLLMIKDYTDYTVKSTMEWETVSTLLFSDGGVWVFEHLSVCWWEFVCFNMCREREGFKEKEANGWRQAEPKALPNFLPPRSFSNDGSGSPAPLPRALPPPPAFLPLFTPPPLQAPPSLRSPFYCSLLILPKHIVLFALHVLKVKVAAGHAFVDILDVVAGGLEVSGGVVGPWGEHLGEIKYKDWVSSQLQWPWNLYANISMLTLTYCQYNDFIFSICEQ